MVARKTLREVKKTWPVPINYAGRYIWTGTDGSPVTTYHIDTDRRDIDISSEIAMLVPEATPFMTILMRARKLPVNSTEFIWYDDGAPNWYTQIDNDSGYSAVATTMKVKDASFLRPKDLLKNTRTGEMSMSWKWTRILTILP